MNICFRYLDREGREVELESVDHFTSHVREGRITDFTLLYDARTGEWAPARTHTVYRMLSEGKESESGAAPEPADGALADFGVDLTLDDTEWVESREEVLERLRRERVADEDEVGGPGSDVSSVTSSSDWADEHRVGRGGAPSGSKAVPGASPGSEEDREPARPRPAARSHVRPLPRVPDDRTGPDPSWSASRTPAGVGPLVAAAVLAALALLPLYLLARPVAPLNDPASPGPPADGAAGGPSTDGEVASVETGALDDMVMGMDSLRRAHDVERVPEVWLEGRYIGRASDHPEVEAFWRRFRDFTDALRARDAELFRRGFVGRLHERGVSDAMVSIRLVSALRTFEERQPARDSVYARMDELSRRALELHELLVDREADLEYDPTTTTRASRNPILQAWSSDRLLTESIWALLDEILGELAWIRGDRETTRDRVMAQLLEKLRDVSADDAVRSATRSRVRGPD